MSAEPKPEGLTEAEKAEANQDLEGFVMRWLYQGAHGHLAEPPPREAIANLLADARNAIEAMQAAGWVSPEEATAREAAARREALEEYREALDSQDPDVLLTWPDVRDDVTSWIHDILAEPERAEEGR